MISHEIIGDDMYVNCEYRVAAHFPTEPKFRDITYRDGALSAPARQFYVEQGKSFLSVTVVHFANGPDKDSKLVDNAVAAIGRRGEMRFNYPVWYDEPNIGGRQFQLVLADGRAMRGSAYMADHRLYITEAIADLNDFPAFLFEQSVSLIDANGVDLDGNPVNALHGFGRFLGDLIERVRPSHIAVAFDATLSGSFRTRLFPAYKANRDPAPADLKKQFGLCRYLCEALGITSFASGEYEADDVSHLAHSARVASRSRVGRAQGLAQLIRPAEMYYHRRTALP